MASTGAVVATKEDERMVERIAFLGLGTMGGRAAVAVAQSGHDAIGFDPAGRAAASAAEHGVEVTDDPEEAVSGAGIVVLSVPRPEDVRSLATGALRSAGNGTVVVDLSTIDPGTARDVAGTLTDRGVDYLDAPVLGRPAGCGSWTLVAGGPPEAIARVGPVMEQTIAKRVVRVGDVGSGSVVKILNNLMFGAINAVTAEALWLCRESGIDMEVFVETVVDSGAATVSNLFRDIGPRIAAGDDEPVFALDLLAKDNRLAEAVAAEAGATAPIAEVVSALNARAVDLGYGGRDSSAVVHAYERGDGA